MAEIWAANKLKQLFNTSETTRFKLISERGSGFYIWDGNIYQSDIVRACLRPKVKAIGKLIGKHIRETVEADGAKRIGINKEPRIRFLLEEPNPFMTGQKLQEKLAMQLCLNNNAFALIIRNEDGLPVQIYPLVSNSVERVMIGAELYLKFYISGERWVFPYVDIIHLRQDFNNDDIFGDNITHTLAGLMDIVGTTDKGIINAIRNSSVIQWLLKFSASLRPEDVKDRAKEFADNYLSVESQSIGVAAVDSKAEAVRVEPKDYVPNAAQMDRTTARIYSLFNINGKIVQSQYSEDEWNAYYEAEIEPVAIELCGEYTRKLFSRKERGFGNKIIFESSHLATASMNTKLNLVRMVDRGAMTPNEWRAVLNLGPLDGGDVPIRRLDTQTVRLAEDEGKGGADED